MMKTQEFQDQLKSNKNADLFTEASFFDKKLDDAIFHFIHLLLLEEGNSIEVVSIVFEKLTEEEKELILSVFKDIQVAALFLTRVDNWIKYILGRISLEQGKK